MADVYLIIHEDRIAMAHKRYIRRDGMLLFLLITLVTGILSVYVRACSSLSFMIFALLIITHSLLEWMGFGDVAAGIHVTVR